MLKTKTNTNKINKLIKTSTGPAASVSTTEWRTSSQKRTSPEQGQERTLGPPQPAQARHAGPDGVAPPSPGLRGSSPDLSPPESSHREGPGDGAAEGGGGGQDHHPLQGAGRDEDGRRHQLAPHRCGEGHRGSGPGGLHGLRDRVRGGLGQRAAPHPKGASSAVLRPGPWLPASQPWPGRQGGVQEKMCPAKLKDLKERF